MNEEDLQLRGGGKCEVRMEEEEKKPQVIPDKRF